MHNSLGRLETIEQDFNFLCNRLHLNATLPHKNQSQHKKYMELYDKESKQLVQNAFKKDIKLLGYDFDCYDKQPVNGIIQKNLNLFSSIAIDQWGQEIYSCPNYCMILI